ncbi:hypothetical protein L1987_30418 [Smallanthus sonchifolius]|uniref:Uncharacterized protein n=1 Tax=Smallanthus sonchifolius TaxID=185202 RepID=A0ACB9I3J7_9ASTR|nr:hypothetical protein L1987_30418 [Smallanthus sonchifolius]
MAASWWWRCIRLHDGSSDGMAAVYRGWSSGDLTVVGGKLHDRNGELVVEGERCPATTVVMVVALAEIWRFHVCMVISGGGSVEMIMAVMAIIV